MSKAEQARDDGINRAVAHANRVNADWADKAYAELIEFARLVGVGAKLTSEEIRIFSEGRDLPSPPDKRAWGGVMLRAARRGILKKVGSVKAKDPKVHCNEVSLWEIISTTSE